MIKMSPTNVLTALLFKSWGVILVPELFIPAIGLRHYRELFFIIRSIFTVFLIQTGKSTFSADRINGSPVSAGAGEI